MTNRELVFLIVKGNNYYFIFDFLCVLLQVIALGIIKPSEFEFHRTHFEFLLFHDNCSLLSIF